MAALSGVDCSVTHTGGYVTKASAWTINITGEEVDISQIGQTWKNFLGGIKGWNGTYTCRLDDSYATTMDDLNIAGDENSPVRSSAAATFTFGTQKFSGSIIVTEISANVAVESGAVEIEFTFVGDGALYLVTDA